MVRGRGIRRRFTFLLTATLALLTLGGCPLGGASPNGGGNSNFDTATPISFGADGKALLEARISNPGGVHMYDLGILGTGDQVFVDVRRRSGDLDAVAAIFDADQNIHAFNDDRIPDASDLNPLLDITILGPEGRYFLGIAPFPGTNTSGEYSMDIRISRGTGDATPRPQTVLLHWAAADNVVVENVGAFSNLPTFSAERIGPYFGQTDQLKTLIQDHVAEQFAPFNLILLNTDDHEIPVEPHSTVYFGTFNRRAFGISQQIDTQNADPADNSIIFIDSFRGAFSVTPTLEQMATAIGNTVSHEIGHLLGLVHTKDCFELMDTTCGNDSILARQSFGLAPLDSSVFPLGFQDAFTLIGWTIGFSGL